MTVSIRRLLTSTPFRALLAVVTVLGVLGATLPVDTPTASAGTTFLGVAQDAYSGIAHVTYGDGTTPGDPRSREDEATAAGAGWNRWVIYWTDVESSPGLYDYSRVDRAIEADRAAGMSTDAVLMATPSFYATGGSSSLAPPRIEDKRSARIYEAIPESARSVQSSAISPPSNLYASVFADGTDIWAPGKLINPSNHWADFVSRTTARYAGQVGAWEIWNEPDFSYFWSGSVDQYTRLLKVAYLAAKAADPSAKVLVGGMMYWEWTNRTGQEHAWLRAFLSSLDSDPSRQANNYYFDGIPWHWYSRASDVYNKTLSARTLLAQHGINGKDIWVNEANAPACGEPPVFGSCVTPDNPSSWAAFQYPGSATLSEQAAFVIQSAAYARAAGVQRYFAFQYRDDGVGEAFGLVRNDGTQRPAYTAYRVAARYLSGVTQATRTSVGDYEKIVLQTSKPTGQQRVTVAWKRTRGSGSLTIPGSGNATLVTQDGVSSAISAGSDGFTIQLSGATDNRNFTSDPNDFIIGGPPILLVEDTYRSSSTTGGLLSNGSFESGDFCPSGWACGGSSSPSLSGNYYRGERSMLLGRYFVADPSRNGASISSVSHSISIPLSGAPRLRVQYRLSSAEYPQYVSDWQLWPDRFEVSVVDQAYQQRYLFADWRPGGWREANLDLSSFRGQAITIVIDLFQSSTERLSTALVDEVALWPYRSSLLPIFRK